MTEKTKYVLELTQPEADKVRQACWWDNLRISHTIYDALVVDAKHAYAGDVITDSDYVLELTQAEAEHLRTLMPASTVGQALAKVL